MIDRTSKIFLILVMVAIGCSKNAGLPTDNTLKIHFPKLALTLDPQKMEDAFSMAIVGQVYRGLFRFSPRGDVNLDLAESWTESPDHLRYVVTLKPAKFSDGAPITSRNVQMTFARMFFIGSSMGADLDYISGVKEFRKSKNLSVFGVKPISERQVEFKLSQPSALFLKHLAVTDSSILPINDFKEALNPTVFSGPYKVDSRSEARVEIEKWRQDPVDSAKPPSRIVYTMTDDSAEELAKAGGTDSLDHDRVSADTEQALLKSGWLKAPTEVVAEHFVILNPTSISKEIRSYLYSQVDPQELLKVINRPNYVAAFGLIPTLMQGEITSADPEKHITRSDHIHGAVTLDYTSSDPLDVATAQYLKSVWSTPNFEVRFNDVSNKDKLSRMFGKKAQALIGRKGIDYPDGYSVLTYFKGGYDGNYFFVNDKKLDTEINSAAAILDTSARTQKYRDIQKTILKLHTVIPLFFGSNASGLWGPKVKSVPPHPMGYHMLPMESVEIK